jgi:hypothetical protein
MGNKFSRQKVGAGGKLGIRIRVARPGFRWAAAALGVAIAFLGPANAVASAAAAPRAAVMCTDNWVGPASGTSNWATAADWSAGVPNGNSTVACIQKAGTYTVQATTPGDGAAAIVVGGAASGTQTLQIEGINFGITQPSEVLKRGVLSLTPTSSAGAAISATGTTISLTIAHGGTLSSAGTSSVAADIATPLLINKGTVTLAAASNDDNTGTTTDKGSFTVASGATLTSSSTDFIHSAGKLTVHGTFNNENTFTQSGGKETGNPVVQHAGTFVDSGGTGSFTIQQTTLTGTVPAGQTLTALGSDQVGTSTTGLTVRGTLTCETPSGAEAGSTLYTDNNTAPGITVASGGTLSTTGPGNLSAEIDANLSADIDVDAGGTLTVANPATTFDQGTVYTLTNSGTVQVTATGYLDIGGNDIVDSTSTGTIGVTVGSNVTLPDGTIYDTSNRGFTASGTLAVNTVGSEAGGDVITDTNGLATTFSSLSFNPASDTYTVSYPGMTAVELTPA